MNSKKLLGLGFFFVVAYSFLVRVFYAKSGLPYIHVWDEPQTASTALNMLKTGDLNPHFFNYGTLLIYINYIVDVFHYLYLMGKPENAESYLTSIDDIKINADTGWHWTISHPSFYFWNKLVTVVLGTGTVVFTYLIARNVWENKWTGLLSAAFLGALGYHIERSAFITTDAPVAFFVLGCIYFSLLFIDRGLTKHLIVSLIFCGLAAATKYNSALVVMLPALAMGVRYFSDKGKFPFRWLVMLPLVPLATFFIAMPYAFFDVLAFLKGIGFEVRHYKVLGHGPATSKPGIEHIFYQLRIFHNYIGTIASALTCIGLLGVFNRPKLIFVLIFPIFFFLYMTQMTVNFHRNFVQVYPFIGILVASSSIVIYSATRQLSKKYLNKDNRVPLFFISAMFIGLTGQMAYGSWVSAVKVKNELETRSQAIVQTNKYEYAGNVYIAKELRIHEQDLRKLNKPYKIKSIEEMNTCFLSDKGSLLILPANATTVGEWARLNVFQNTIQANKQLLSKIADNNIVARIGDEQPLVLDELSVNPGVIVAVLKSDGACPHPEGNVLLDHMVFSKSFPIGNDGEIQMIWAGEIRLPAYALGAGYHLLRFEHKGTIADGKKAEIVVTIINNDDTTVVSKYSFVSNTNFSWKSILLDVPASASHTIQIAFVNDFYSAETKEDRNVAIRNINLTSFDAKPDGFSWDGKGSVVFNDKAVFETHKITAHKIGFSLDHNDEYKLCLRLKQTEDVICKNFGPHGLNAGLRNYKWKLKEAVSITSLTFTPVNGDGKYSIGHIYLE